LGLGFWLIPKRFLPANRVSVKARNSQAAAAAGSYCISSRVAGISSEGSGPRLSTRVAVVIIGRASPRGLFECKSCQWHDLCEFRSEPDNDNSYIESEDGARWVLPSFDQSKEGRGRGGASDRKELL